LFRKVHIINPIFKRKPKLPESVESRLDQLIERLQEDDLDNEEIFMLHQRFTEAVNDLPGYKNYLNDRATEHTPPLILSRQKNLKLLRRSSDNSSQMSNTFRILVSLLIITFGFAMIILPAPPYFEMFTIFYFNEQDGFTLMDLISLIIIFAGIYTLVTAVYRRNRD
jgi:hypothetical protein